MVSSVSDACISATLTDPKLPRRAYSKKARNEAGPADEVLLRSMSVGSMDEKTTIPCRARVTATLSLRQPPSRLMGPKFMLMRPLASGA